MFTRSFTAAALAVCAIALSGAAYAGPVYQGGPKSSIPTATANQTFEVKKPYAEYVPGTPASRNRHIYRGGPQTAEPHGR